MSSVMLELMVALLSLESVGGNVVMAVREIGGQWRGAADWLWVTKQGLAAGRGGTRGRLLEEEEKWTRCASRGEVCVRREMGGLWVFFGGQMFWQAAVGEKALGFQVFFFLNSPPFFHSSPRE